MPVPTNAFALHLRRTYGYTHIAGVDEVGCGCLAGPVVSAAVILRPGHPLPSLNDSKKVSAALRARLDSAIKHSSLAWSIGSASVEEIDTLGIRPATLLASQRALLGLDQVPDAAISDAFMIPGLPFPCHPLVRADSHVRAVAAASIIAKVHRDALMSEHDRTFPGYGFGVHKGYGTEAHLQALRTLGPCALHRTSFAPVRAVEQKSPLV